MRWAASDRIPLRVDGTGLLDCHLYRQDEAGASRLILHLVNLSHPGAWRAPLHELMDAGPFEIAVSLPCTGGERRRTLPGGGADAADPRGGGLGALRGCRLITDHEVVVIETDEREARLDELQS